jgi:hypothetical protein
MVRRIKKRCCSEKGYFHQLVKMFYLVKNLLTKVSLRCIILPDGETLINGEKA